MNIFPEVLCPCGTCVGRATAYNYGEPVCFKWTLQATDCTLASSICGDTTDTAYCQVCGARLSFEKNGKPVADVRASALRDALDAAEARAAQSAAREMETRNALQFACDQLAELLDDACPHGTCPAVEDQDPAQCDLSQKASCVMGACEAAVTLADGGVPDPSCCMSVVGIITARAAQSAAQVRVLAERLFASGGCPGCQAKCEADEVEDGDVASEECVRALLAWSSAQAQGGGGGE